MRIDANTANKQHSHHSHTFAAWHYPDGIGTDKLMMTRTVTKEFTFAHSNHYMKKIVFVFLSLWNNIIYSQDWEWLETVKSNFTIEVKSVSALSDSIVFVTGKFRDTLQYGTDTIINSQSAGGISNDIHLMAISAKGKLLWYKTWTSTTYLDAVACRYTNGKVYVVGSYKDTMLVEQDTLFNAIGGGTWQSVYVVCYDSAGNYVFSKMYGRSVNGYYVEDAIAGDSALYLSGTFNSPIYNNNDTTIADIYPAFFLLKIGLSGERKWIKAGTMYLSQGDFVKSHLSLSSDNKLLVGGHYTNVFYYATSNSINGPLFGSFLMKTDTAGNPLWLKNFSSTDSVVIEDIETKDSMIYVCGKISKSSNFDSLSLSSGSEGRAFFIRHNSNGMAMNVWSTQKGRYTNAVNLTKDKSRNLYLTIAYQDTLQFLGAMMNDNYPGINQAGIFKITTDTIVRYAHLLGAGDLVVNDAVCDVLGNYYIGGSFYKIIRADTNNIIDSVTIGAIPVLSGFIGKISCKISAPVIIATDTTLCFNESTVLYSNALPYYSFWWNTGSNDSSITVSNGATYSLYLTDENGCSSDTSSVPIIQYSLTTVPVQQLCDSIYVNHPFNGNWYFDTTLLDSSNSTIASQNGWYYYQSTDSNGCKTKDSIFIQIIPQNILLSHQCDSLYIMNANGTTIWYWNGTISDTATYFIVTQSGLYNVLVNDSIGCIWYSDTLNIEMGRLSPLINVFPNPVMDEFSLELSAEGIVQIYDIMGRLMKQWEIINKNSSTPARCNDNSDGNKYVFNIGDLKSGVYELLLKSDRVLSIKLIKME